MQDGRRQNANEKNNQIRRSEVHVHCYSRARILHNHTCLLQSDECDEKPDPSGNTVLQTGADGIENELAKSAQRQNQKEHTGNEHHPERDLPSIGETSCCRGWERGENKKEILTH